MTRIGNFTRHTREALENATNGRCARCGQWTRGLTTADGESILMGWASHIHGAGERGPRSGLAAGMTPEQIRAIDNGIWLCICCAVVVDRDPATYTVQELRDMQAKAVRRAAENQDSARRPAYATVDQIFGRARAFAHRLRQIGMPCHKLADCPSVQERVILAIGALLRDVGCSDPNHPLHGLDPALVALQGEIHRVLKAYASLVTDGVHFRRDFGTYYAVRTIDGYPAAPQHDLLMLEFHRLLALISAHGTTQFYYGPQW